MTHGESEDTLLCEAGHLHNACESHCCVRHGCKYNLICCPVLTRRVRQEHPCEECREEQASATPPTATLRDQFAMAALTGLLAAPSAAHQYAREHVADYDVTWVQGKELERMLADEAYDYADAMLAAREVTE